MDTASQPGELAISDPPIASLAESIDSIPAALLEELAHLAATDEVGLTSAEFALMLAAIGNRHNFGLPPGTLAGPSHRERFYRALQLPDLALAQACALGRDSAWQRFVARFQSPLRQTATAITASSSLGADLADSLYAELFGLTERAGERKSPLASYAGRGSLMGWLRTTLAQRHIDHYRRTWRESPLPEHEESQPAVANPEPAPAPAELSHLSRSLANVLKSLPSEDRFLLSAYYLDQHTLLEIARLLRVHEATVSRKLKRVTTSVHKQLLKHLQATGLSKRAAEESLGADPRDLTLNLRTLLQTSPPTPFSTQNSSTEAIP